MGACSSTVASDNSPSASTGADHLADSELQFKASKAIERMLKEDEKKQAKEVKILLLGPGASGKSTILKQMKLIHLNGFMDHELEAYRRQIWNNVCQSMSAAIGIMEERAIPFEHKSNEASAALLYPLGDLQDCRPFPEPLFEPLSRLWQDSGVQLACLKSTEAVIPENFAYFYSDLKRLFAPNYIPSDQDVLRCRQKTTGIAETVFQASGLTYRLFDVGGQRSERKKWIHCFENVTAVLFLVAISGYDQVLMEDKDSNSMQEALMLFDSICNSQWFQKTSLILFLNKVDIFKTRILVSPIRKYFPDYEGEETDYDSARTYFRDRFTKLNRSQTKSIYATYTTAIDTNLMRIVMTSVYDTIVAGNLTEAMAL